MKTKSVAVLYGNCMSRLSTVAVSTLVPALNVLSTTLPDSTFLSLVRTNAPPLPGLTCWNSTTDQSWPSSLSTMPFLRSFVVATEKSSCSLAEVYARTALDGGARRNRPPVYGRSGRVQPVRAAMALSASR